MIKPAGGIASVMTARAPMGRVLRAFVALMLVSGFLAVAPADAAAQRGSFFFAEGQLGYGYGGGFAEGPDGFATKLTAGVGGKWVDFPTRFYVIGNLTLTNYGGDVRRGPQVAETDRAWFAWSFGLRTLTPLARNLRLLVDLSLGEANVDSAASINGVERYDAQDSSFLIEAGIGLQYRLIPMLSLGARVDLAIATNMDDVDEITELVGLSSADQGGINPSYLFTITLHL